MNADMPRKRWSWPLAFFILNFAAIVAWFALQLWSPEREMLLTAMNPLGAEVDPERVTEIRLDYNVPLDPETINPDTIRLIPAASGRTEKAGDKSVRFVVQEPLRPATSYTVVVSPGLRGNNGETPPAMLLEFATSRFRLESASQVGFDRDSYTVELTFNQPIAASDLNNAITTLTSRKSDPTDAPPVTVIGSDNAKRQRIRIGENAPCYLLMTLPAGMTGASGPLGLENDEKLLWRIVGQQRVDEKNRPDWTKDLAAIELKTEIAFLGMAAEWDDGKGLVRVRTTVPPELGKIRRFVKVEPELPVTFATTWGGFKIMGDFDPGKQYRITLRQGLPAGHAGGLAREISRHVWFDDLPERLAFSYGGGFLSPSGLLKIPVKTRNLDEFNLGVRKLYASNIVDNLLREYDGSPREEYSEPQTTRKYKTNGKRNQEQETLVDVRELTEDNGPLGVYGLEIWQNDRRWRSRETMLAVSNLGLSARMGRKNMLAWTTSLSDGAPRGGVKVSLYSNRRQLLANGESGDDGVAILDVPPLPEGESPALVLAEASDGEFSFVRLDRDRRSYPMEAQRGDEYPRGYQAFLTIDRGVYRGGETVLLAGLVRNANVAVVPELPLELRLVGPDNRELLSVPAATDEFGRLELETPLGEGYPGGLYAIKARLPGQKETLGSVMFMIADYLPETLSIAMEHSEEKEEADRDQVNDNRLDVKVSRLAGGEPGRIPVVLDVSYHPAPFAPDGWEGWRFGDSRRSILSGERYQVRNATDADGSITLRWDNPVLNFPAAARMRIRLEAEGTGGRATTESLDKPLYPSQCYVGLNATGLSITAGKETVLEIAAVSPSGETFADAGEWTGSLMRVEYEGVMRVSSEGRLIYDWVRQEIPEEEYSGKWKNGRAEIAFTPRAGGGYRLVVESSDGTACVYDFYVSGSGASWYGEDPERLTINLDKENYRIGEVAVASVASPFAGLALVTVETTEVLSHRLVDFTEGDNTFEITVEDAMRPNAFVTATLIRPIAPEAVWKPHRLSGAARISVDNADRKLLVKMETPETFAPGKSGEITVRVTRDGKPAPKAAVVVWGVDVGVLSLTGYRLRSPWDAFYQARRAEVREADMYSRLAPELAEWRLGNEAAPGGGDGVHEELTRRLNPIFAKRVQAAVVFDAKLTTDEEGVARAVLPVPEFAGRLKMLCWAASDNALGAAEREIEVKAPVSVDAAWPRFAAIGDAFSVPVSVLNRSGGDGTVKLECRFEGGLEMDNPVLEVAVPDNQARTVLFSVKALEAGVAKAEIRASLGEAEFSQRVEFSVRPPVMFDRKSGMLVLEPGVNHSFAIAPELLEKNSRATLFAGGSPMISLAGSLNYLLDYPYGCAEQTAARLLALTALPDLLAVSRPGQLESGDVARQATACVERLQMLQNPNGSLKMWPNSSDELFWVSAQALFTLSESASAGHPVPKNLVDNLAAYLNGRLEYRLSPENLAEDDGESAAMACLALAKTEKIQRSWLLRLEEVAETMAKNRHPLSSAALAHLCEAVAVAGDREAGAKLYDRFKPNGERPGITRDRTTELSAWLMAAMTVGADAAETSAYAMQLAFRLKDGYTFWSTRENSLVLAALGRYWRKTGLKPDSTARLVVGGAKSSFSTRKGKSWHKLSAGVKVEVENPGPGSLQVFWLAEGIPLSGEVKEGDRGIVARRAIYDLEGNEVASPYRLTQGEVYEIRLKIEGKADDLAVADLLPAGLEIEDANLKGRTGKTYSAGKMSVKNVERRDDRLLLFAALSGEGEYRYLVRAVTGGTFVWPALDASRMYDSSVHSIHGGGKVTIVGGNEAVNDR